MYAMDGLSSDTEELEYVLLNKNEVFVYKIPPRPSTGHRAEDWNQCIWKGKLQVTAKGQTCTVKFIEAHSGELFAQCPLPHDYEQACERTVDSSRYFVVRLDNGQGRHAFVGMGFESRNDAFDFNCALVDFANRNDTSKEQEKIMVPDSSKAHKLADGERITVNLKGLKARRERSDKPMRDTAVTSNGSNFSVLIPPPPESSPAMDAEDDDFFSF